MVGRFVEQQQVGAAHQRLREVQAHAPAAREAADRLARLFQREAEAEQQGFGARGRGVAVGVGECGVRFAFGRAVVRGGGGGDRALRSRATRRRRRACRRARCLSAAGVSCATWAICQFGGIEKSPPSACSSPRSTANSVDLPAPFAPTRPAFSPGLRVNVVLSKSGLVPRARLNWLKRITKRPAEENRYFRLPGPTPGAQPGSAIRPTVPAKLLA